MSDTLNVIALALATCSVLSGFSAVGSKDWWDFERGWSEYIKGNGRALLYLLVTVTTALSVFHVAILLDWLVSPSTDALGEGRASGRLIWHCMVASCFIALHAWTRSHRKTRQGQPDRYFWGSGDGGS